MESYTHFFEILDDHARRRGNKIAVYYDQKEITYAALNENINRFGNVLKNMGVTSKDQIILAIPDGPDFYYAFFGAMKCGARPALSSPDLSREDYDYILNDSQASVIITISDSEAASLNAVKKYSLTMNPILHCWRAPLLIFPLILRHLKIWPSCYTLPAAPANPRACLTVSGTCSLPHANTPEKF